MNWIRRLVAGNLIDKLEIENKRLNNLIANYDTESYDRNARIGVLEDDIQAKVNETLIAKQAYEHKATECSNLRISYDDLQLRYSNDAVRRQSEITKLNQQIVDLKKLQNETSLKLTEAMSEKIAVVIPIKKTLSTRKRKTE